MCLFCSIARKDSDKQAKAQILACSGGHWVKLVFYSSWAPGKWGIWRAFSKPKNSCSEKGTFKNPAKFRKFQTEDFYNIGKRKGQFVFLTCCEHQTYFVIFHSSIPLGSWRISVFSPDITTIWFENFVTWIIEKLCFFCLFGEWTCFEWKILLNHWTMCRK